MAINATPLNAYRLNLLSSIAQQAANRREMNEGLGAIAEGIDDGLNQRKARNFFAQFDNNEEIRIEEEIRLIDERINELKKKLEEV